MADSIAACAASLDVCIAVLAAVQAGEDWQAVVDDRGGAFIRAYPAAEGPSRDQFQLYSFRHIGEGAARWPTARDGKKLALLRGWRARLGQ